MKYLLLMYGDENAWTPEERKDCMVESLKVCDDLATQDKFIATAPLQPAATAATVRVRDGQTLVTAGPFAETTEHLGGYFVVDLADLDEAISVASRLPSVRKGAAEIRPLLALDGAAAPRPFSVGTDDPKGRPYMLLCYHDEAAWQVVDPAVRQAAMSEAVALTHELSAAGQFLNASPLHPAATATCVRVRDGKREITDGPFTETTEVLGGFYLILAASPDDALRVAARHSGARFGSVEVRPLFDFSEFHKTASIS